MIDVGVLKRRLSSASKIFQEEGLGGVFGKIFELIELQYKLFVARDVVSVTLDGCTFSLESIPRTRMRLSLLMGEYEERERGAVLKYVDQDQPVVELGGCIGVVACITNRILRDPRSHVVVEASPGVTRLLEQSRDRNGSQFEIINAAIAYGQSSVMFSSVPDLWVSSLYLGDRGTVTAVRAMDLGTIVGERKFDEFTLICDIEGNEYDLVLNEPAVVKRARTIILETHSSLIGDAKTNQMLETLKGFGFNPIDQEATVVVMKRN